MIQCLRVLICIKDVDGLMKMGPLWDWTYVQGGSMVIEFRVILRPGRPYIGNYLLPKDNNGIVI